MANTTSSANMHLPIPVVGIDPGPDYALNVNNSLTLIDQHDHSAGYGVPVTPAGLNISSDLSFLNNNALALRSAKFQPQVSPLALASDIGCLYEAGVDLYYNDGSGNQIRITQSGAVAGTPGSIANLVSPASASYSVSTGTFIFQSNTNTAANIDAASYILRNSTVSSHALTLQPPTAMGSDYTLTLPALPVSQKIMTLDASGNISAPYTVDNSTISITANVIGVVAGGIGTTQLADGSITQAKKAIRATGSSVGAGGVAISSSCGSFQTSVSSTFQAVTNLSVTITTLGNPVQLMLIGDGSGSPADISQSSSSGSNVNSQVQITRGGSQISQQALFRDDSPTQPNTIQMAIPSSSIKHLDIPGAGTYTYAVQLWCSSVDGSHFAQMNNTKLVAYEL